MACFLAPMSEAVVMTIVQKVIQKRAGNKGNMGPEGTDTPWARRLGWLNRMLWGGSVLLAFEHLWHGEIVPWPPFLTAMKNAGDIGPMLHEIATVGTAMALTVTAVWALMVLVVEIKVRPVGRAGSTRSGGGAE